LIWAPPVDLNGVVRKNNEDIKDVPLTSPYFGVQYPSATYKAMIDTMFCRVNVKVVSTSNGAPTTDVIKLTDYINWASLDNSDLKKLLGSNDSVRVNWTVETTDRAPADWTKAVPSAAGTFVITKIDNTYYLEVTKDSLNSLASNKNSIVKLMVTDSQAVAITAYDAPNVPVGNPDRDIIRGFNKVTNTDGTSGTVTLQIHGMLPTTDAKQERIISYVDPVTGAYTKSAIDLTTGKFTIPAKLFVNGVATFNLQDRRAYDVISINILASNNLTSMKFANSGDSKKPLIKLANSDSTVNYSFDAGAIVKIKTTITPRRLPNVVYLLKKFEVIMRPTDMYGNYVTNWTVLGIHRQFDPSNDIDERSLTGYTILDRRDPLTGLPYTGDRKSYDPYPDGAYYLYVTPVIVHDQIGVNSMKVTGLIADPVTSLPIALSGNTEQILVKNHIPSMKNMADSTQFKAFASGTEVGSTLATAITVSNSAGPAAIKYDFSWKAAVDSNDTHLVRSNGAGTIEDQCVPKYTLRFKEWPTKTYANVDSLSKNTTVTITAGDLYNLFVYVSGKLPKEGNSLVVNGYLTVEDQTYFYTDPLYTALLQSYTKQFFLKAGVIVGVKPNDVVPVTYALNQNYPNPFNPTTTIQYDLPKESNVKLVIYNILGQPVRTLVNTKQNASTYNVVWDGKNDLGNTVASGVYIYKISAGDFSMTKKMNFLK
jgi:hypothetical protein